MDIFITALITTVVVSAITYFVLRSRWKIGQKEAPPRIATAVTMGRSGTVKNLTGGLYECNEWIEMWTNAIKVLDEPCDIGDIETSTINELFDETQATIDSATASLCDGIGCIQVKIGSDSNAFDCYISTGGIPYVSIVRQVWFRCVAPF